MDKVELGVGWTVDNDSLKAGMERSKKAIEGVGQSIETVENKVNEGINKNVSSIGLLAKSYQALEIQAQSYSRIVQTSMDPKVISEYNVKLKNTLEDMARIKSMGLDQALNPNVSANKWNGLQNSINQISRELPAFTYSAQTGFMAISNNIPILVDEISRLKVENDALVASGKKGIPIWKQIISSMLSWHTLLSVGVMLLTVYGKEIGNWISALFKGGQAAQDAALRIEIMNKALTGGDYGKAIKEIAELRSAIDGAKAGVVSKSDAVKLYNSTIGKTTGKIKDWNDLEKWQLDNEKKYLEFMYRKAEAQAMLQVAIDKTIEAQKKSIEGPGFAEYAKAFAMTGATNLQESANFQNTLGKAQLQIQAGKSMNMFAEANRKLQEFAKENGFDLYQFNDEKSNGTKAKILAAHKDLMEELMGIDREYGSMFFSDDQKEMAAFEEKFQKIREKIEEFNKDPKNFIKIDVDVVDGIQEKLRKQLEYKQETDGLVREYESDFESWKEYEELKKNTSEQYAKSRYGTMAEYYQEVGKRIEESIDKIRNKDGELSSEELVRLDKYYKVLDDIKEFSTSMEDERYKDLLSQMIGYDQKRKDLISKYDADRKDAEKWATTEQLAEMDRKHIEELDKLDDSNIQKLESYRDLFSGIEKLSDASARKVIANARKMLNSDTAMSAEERKKIEAAIKEAESSLSGRLPDRINKVADEFSSIASSVSSVNQELGDMIGILSNVLRATANIKTGFDDLKKGIDNYNQNKADGGGGLLGSISAIAGIAGPAGQIVSAVSSVVSGVINIFKASKESARKAAEEMREYKLSVLEGEMEHNRLLRERARSQQDINDLTLEELKLQQELLKNQSAAASNDFESLLDRIHREGQQITGQRTERYGGFLGIGKKTRVVDITKGIGGYSYEELEKLYETNRLTESTRKLFELLRASKEEMDALVDSAAALDLEQLDRMSGGLTAESISGKIKEGLKDGRRAVKDFSGDLEDMIGDALLSAMSYTALDAPLKELVEKFRQDAKDGLSEDEINRFREGYEDIVQSGIDAIKEIEKVTGKQIGSSGSLGAEAGRINRTVSEDTASAILGFERARFDLAKQQLTAVLSALDFESRTYGQIIEQVKYLKAIEQNTRDTVAELKNVSSELKNISKNTKGGVYAGG